MNFRAKNRSNSKERWFERDNIPALDNALKNAVYEDHNVRSHLYNTEECLTSFFLECGYVDFYSVSASYPRETDIFFSPAFERVITNNYINSNEPVMKYLSGIIGSEGFKRTMHAGIKTHIGFTYNSFTSDTGDYIDFISGGMHFMEDSQGHKLVITIKNGGVIGSKDRRGEFYVTVSSNSHKEGSREACLHCLKLIRNELNYEMKSKSYALNTDGNPIKVEKLSWESLKIPPSLKKDIQFHIMDFISNIDAFRDAGIKPSRGLIIAGPPGNGKTMLGKILCTNIDVPFFFSSATDFNQSFGKPKINSLYEMASAFAPAIVLIEDADIFLNERRFNINQGTLTDFLNIIDGLRENDGIVTILTCNNPELLDEAVKNRPKRFDVIIEFGNPGYEERREILHSKLQKYISEEDSSIIDDVARDMEGFSGAHITEIADRLIMLKIYRKKDHIDSDMIDEITGQFGFKRSRSSRIGLI